MSLSQEEVHLHTLRNSPRTKDVQLTEALNQQPCVPPPWFVCVVIKLTVLTSSFSVTTIFICSALLCALPKQRPCGVERNTQLFISALHKT